MYKAITIILIDEEGNEKFKYESIQACAKSLDINPGIVAYRIKTGVPYDGLVYKKSTDENSLKNIVFNFQNKKEKPNILKYEVKYKRVCITPCPFYKDKTIFIGSALCEGCSSFRGKCRERHEIACVKKKEVIC